MSNKKRGSMFQQKLIYDKSEFPDLSSENAFVFTNKNEKDLLCDFKKILSEKNNEEQEITKLRKGWVYLYKDSLMKKNNSSFLGEEGVMNTTNITLEMKRAIQLMNKNWEKNKEYDMEMMSYEQYLRIYRRSEYLYEMDPDQEEDEENNESYYEYDDYDYYE